jgi:hypothetical protein
VLWSCERIKRPGCNWLHMHRIMVYGNTLDAYHALATLEARGQLAGMLSYLAWSLSWWQ